MQLPAKQLAQWNCAHMYWEANLSQKVKSQEAVLGGHMYRNLLEKSFHCALSLQFRVHVCFFVHVFCQVLHI